MGHRTTCSVESFRCGVVVVLDVVAISKTTMPQNSGSKIVALSLSQKPLTRCRLSRAQNWSKLRLGQTIPDTL